MSAFPITFGDPGISPSSNSGSSDFQNFLSVAQLAGQDLLAYSAINSNRPSTVQLLPNGQLAVSGGGATSPSILNGTSGFLGLPSIVWIFLVFFLVVLMIRR